MGRCCRGSGGAMILGKSSGYYGGWGGSTASIEGGYMAWGCALTGMLDSSLFLCAILADFWIVV